MTRHGRFLLNLGVGVIILGSRGTPLYRFWDPQWSLLCHKLSKIGHAASLEHIIRYYCAKSGVNRTSSLASRVSQRFGTRSWWNSFEYQIFVTLYRLNYLSDWHKILHSDTLFSALVTRHIGSIVWHLEKSSTEHDREMMNFFVCMGFNGNFFENKYF